MHRSEKLKSIEKALKAGNKNFVFVGEAGSGKSEIALNFAHQLLGKTDKTIHFFDMDMTKPLFRSRDTGNKLEKSGIVMHYQEQFMDAPTLVGGVKKLLRDENVCVVMDVGGDHIGARAIGGFAMDLNKDDATIYYVLNAFRPWSYDIDHVDDTLIGILAASNIQIDKLRLINNPNVGIDTTADEFVEGCRKMFDIVTPFKAVEFACVNEPIFESVKESVDIEVMPLHLYLTYPWLKDQ